MVDVALRIVLRHQVVHNLPEVGAPIPIGLVAPSRPLRHMQRAARIVATMQIKRISPIGYFREVGDVTVHIGEATALVERPLADGGDRGGKGDALQAVAVAERMPIDGDDTFAHGYLLQAAAAKEGPLADGGDRVGDDDVPQAADIQERFITDGFYGIWNDGVLATRYQCIACRLDDGIAVAAGIVYSVAAFHGDVLQVDTEPESTTYCFSVNLD